MWVRRPKVKFYIQNEFLDVLPKPRRATKFIPSWYKRMPRYIKSTEELKHGVSQRFGTVKTCVPFLDAMSVGYIMPMWTNVKIEIEETTFNVVYASAEAASMLTRACDVGHNEVQEATASSMSGHPPSQFSDFADIDRAVYKQGYHIIKLHSPWVIKTPKGWSTLIKPIANNFANPLVPFEAIVDTDSYNVRINLPCFVRTNEPNFELNMGQPIAQMIPFKRDVLQHDVLPITQAVQKNVDRDQKFLQLMGTNAYRKLFWHKSKQRVETEK
jgi:hypothetical protein